ncbi:MAG: insulinase family protein [Chlamydiia bacterium]|nr:insulinase family protein [Chlamydiia bacterium]
MSTLYKNFTYTKTIPIEELSCTLYEIEHSSGANIVHIACDDVENAFCLGLKTWPDSGNGAPHILEHTVLCGSKKYPVKDPFFAMTRRSLNTFMNAFTGPDFTCYPAASCVEQDFYNLLEVYLDAVFFPQLKELSFLQEGHRFEFQTPNDPTTPLTYQGIVYNEMKGAMSSPDSRLWRIINRALFPDLTYAFNSGGDPEEIPNLTYEGLKAFHAQYYHPSRCLFYFYGNLSLEKHLDFLEKHVFSKTQKCDPLPNLPKQMRFSQPLVLEETYPTHEDNAENQTMAAFGWLTCAPTELEDSLALTLIDQILTDHDASPLKRALLESGLCKTADGHLDHEMSEIPYIIICKGCVPEDVPKLKAIIFKTLQALTIDPETAANALHQLEFERLEIGGGGLPFGLNLYFRSAALKAYGGAPESGLKFYEAFESLQKKIQNPQYLKGLIQKYLLNNNHFIQLTFKPDPQLAAREEQNERAKLDAIQKTLSEKQAESIVHTADQLKTYQLQSEAQDLECLPKIQIADVPQKGPDFALKQADNVFHHPVFTNHISYISLVLDLPDLTEEELPYAQLYTSFMTELGVGNKTYEQTLEEMQGCVGGLSASISLHAQAKSPNTLKPALVLKGKALQRNAPKLVSLLRAFATSPRTDEASRIKELILQTYTYMQQRLTQSSMNFAIQLATSHLSKIGSINSRWQGLNFFKFIEDLANNIDAKLPYVVEQFTKLKFKLLHLQNPHIVIACDEKSYSTLDLSPLKDMPTHPFTPFALDPTPFQAQNQGRIISSPVAFTSLGLKTIDASDPRAPFVSLASELFDNRVLHPKIREQGGAYGSGSSYNAITGCFYFYGFRDPNIESTLQAFYAAADEIGSGSFSEQDLEEAKLGLIQAYDSPIYPGSRGMAAYIWARENKSFAFRQTYRETVLNATKDQIMQVVQTEIAPNINANHLVSFASKELLEKENRKLNYPLHISSI